MAQLRPAVLELVGVIRYEEKVRVANDAANVKYKGAKCICIQQHIVQIVTAGFDFTRCFDAQMNKLRRCTE